MHPDTPGELNTVVAITPMSLNPTQYRNQLKYAAVIQCLSYKMNRGRRKFITQNETRTKTLRTATCTHATDVELKMPFRTTEVGFWCF